MTYFLILTTFKTKCIFKLKQHKKITSNSGNITEATYNYIIFGKLLHFSIYSFLTGKISCWHKLLGPPRRPDSGGLGCAPQICICIKCQSAAAATLATPGPRITLREPKSLSSYPILFFSKIMWNKKAKMTILTLESRIPFWPSNTISRTLFQRKKILYVNYYSTACKS